MEFIGVFFFEAEYVTEKINPRFLLSVNFQFSSELTLAT